MSNSKLELYEVLVRSKRGYVAFSSGSTLDRVMKEGKENLSEEQKRKAAEAVVDAAICCHNLLNSAEIPKETRETLIDSLSEDPSLAGELFGDGSLLDGRWC